MNEETEILKALKHGFEMLNAKMDGIDLRLSSVEGEIVGINERLGKVEHKLEGIENDVKGIRNKQDEQDRILDILTVRTTRLEAKIS